MRTAGFGLAGLRERVDLVDGTLRIDASPGHGARLTITLPVAHRPPVIRCDDTDDVDERDELDYVR